MGTTMTREQGIDYVMWLVGPDLVPADAIPDDGPHKMMASMATGIRDESPDPRGPFAAAAGLAALEFAWTHPATATELLFTLLVNAGAEHEVAREAAQAAQASFVSRRVTAGSEEAPTKWGAASNPDAWASPMRVRKKEVVGMGAGHRPALDQLSRRWLRTDVGASFIATVSLRPRAGRMDVSAIQEAVTVVLPDGTMHPVRNGVPQGFATDALGILVEGRKLYTFVPRSSS